MFLSSTDKNTLSMFFSSSFAPRKVEESPIIFVGNLNFKSTVDDIWEHFESCGEVVDVRIATYPDGRKKGFAHVEFTSVDDARKGLAMNGQEFSGREMRIDFAHGLRKDEE